MYCLVLFKQAPHIPNCEQSSQNEHHFEGEKNDDDLAKGTFGLSVLVSEAAHRAHQMELVPCSALFFNFSRIAFPRILASF